MTASTKTVQAGRHQVTATVFGSGEPAVVIEPSFGGLAAEWQPVAESLAGDTTVVTYDRAPNGESSQARDHRTPADIATDLHAALAGLGISGPVILVGHSVGGMYVRQYAAQYPGDVAGMVLIESSHEGQKPLLNEVFTLKVKLEGLLFYPRMIFSTRKFRGGGDRRSAFREWFSFNKLTAADKPLAPGALGDKPLIVLTRADGGPYGGRQWRLWHGFHVEQAQLSANSRHVFSATADHMLHQSDPELVVTAIREVARSARTGTPVRDIAVPAGG
jgi:pimeloyl-ACP methyl ester carboxylesterase